MDKQEIQLRLRKVKTVAGFAKLLDDVKVDEFQTKQHKITEAKLFHFCSSKNYPNRFHTIFIKKKSGGQREINKPCLQLSYILHIINIVFKAVYTPSDAAKGFAEGRSIVDNARTHEGHNYVFNIDLQNFFPSISQGRVWKRLQLPPFSLPQEVANVLAGICCCPAADGTGNVLPQGAATSPLLTNAICDKLDHRMLGVAKRFGLHYSRYADDMTFSSMHNVYQEDGEFRAEIKRVIEGQGFSMNEKKTRLQRDGERQEVTGITVNQRANVTRKYVKDLRVILHNWETLGYEAAYAKFYPIYKREKGHIKKGEPVMENVVGGKLNYLRMVRGENNVAYQKLQERYDRLAGISVPQNTRKESKTLSVVCYTVGDMQKRFNTTIELHEKEGKFSATCEIDNRAAHVSISKAERTHLAKLKSEGKPLVGTEDWLKKTYMLLCTQKGKNYWLLTNVLHKGGRSRIHSDEIDKLISIWEKSGIDEASEALEAMLATQPLKEDIGEEGASIKKFRKKATSIAITPDFLKAIELMENELENDEGWVQGENSPIDITETSELNSLGDADLKDISADENIPGNKDIQVLKNLKNDDGEIIATF